MDLYSNRRRQHTPRSMDHQRCREVLRVVERRFRLFTEMRLIEILASFLIVLPIFLLLLMVLRHEPRDGRGGFVSARGTGVGALSNVSSFESQQRHVSLPGDQRSVGDAVPSDLRRDVASFEGRRSGSSDFGSTDSFQPYEDSSNKLLGGLLSDQFQEESCLSRYQSFLYRKDSTYRPSSYLLSKLRAYEKLHKQCGPGTQSYKKALGLLKSHRHRDGPGECKYVVWMSFSGLGNRIVSIASAFLYALLSNRVLLVGGGEQISDLFCEPFPETSWLLPSDFPLINQFDRFDQNSDNCYGNMLKRNAINSSTAAPSHLYLHLVHDYDDYDKMFFCEEDQAILGNVPWLMLKTNNYFVPSLFLIPGFSEELSKLFPQRGTVFHHLGRYLFHPSNQVWGLITRYYRAYLQKADEKIGLQIRVFDEKSGIPPHVIQQILSCTQGEKILPEVVSRGSTASSSQNPKVKAVLVTSLTTGYFEILKSMYWENPTVTGDVIGVHQPSHEGHQQTERPMHNRKAWAEMYLLSLTDKLVISPWSTFGYVAQGLGGLKPWILFKAEDQKTPDPPCVRTTSTEPCFHAPPFYDCKAKRGIDTGKLVPHIIHCEDISWGLKVVDGSGRLPRDPH